MSKIGVIGAGVTGGALIKYLKKHHEVLVKDPAKGFNDSFLGESDKLICDSIFVCVPVPTDQNGAQDLTILKTVLKENKEYFQRPVFIRSTILPKTTDHLRKFLKMRLYAMPEFLTERISNESFEDQDIISGCDSEDRESTEWMEHFLKGIFPDKLILLMSNREAELAKYAHNCLASVKINFCNLISKYAETIGANYESVREGFLMSGYIDPMHTMCPGPDGKRGFGGACFPKDLYAFVREIKRLGLQFTSSEAALMENAAYRLAWSESLKPPVVTYPNKFQFPMELK